MLLNKQTGVAILDDRALADGDPTLVIERAVPVEGDGERRMLRGLVQLALDDARRGDAAAIAWLLDDAPVGTHDRFTASQAFDHLGISHAAFRERLRVLLRRDGRRQATGRMALDGALAAA